MELYKYLTILFFLLNSISNYSQEIPIEWGEIPMEDLMMTSVPEDSNASALILCDYGESVFNNDLNLVFTRHLRIKLFNQTGYDLATHSLILYTDDKAEYLDDIEGITYSLNSDGEIIENELDSDDIFEEEIDESRTRYRFTMPGLTPGCIIEIQYKIVAQNFALVRDWIFQHSEPVRWSEYRIRTPINISYSAVTSGYEMWEINERTDGKQIFTAAAKSYLGSDITDCYNFRWAVKNAPAIREEEYISTLDDYANRVYVQLSGYSFSGVPYKQVLRDWKTLVEELSESKYFGERIDVTGKVEEIAGSVTKGLSKPEEKLEAIYNWVTKSIVWSGSNRVYADNNVNQVIEQKKGSNAEMSFLLISLLKSAGITADPLILSTRKNGKIQDLYPIISQFNYTIARANIAGKSYYLDATDPNRPLNILPSKILGVKGLIIKKGSLEWINLPPNKTNSDKIIVNIELSTDGSIVSNIENAFGEYSSLTIRNNLSDKSEADIVKEQFETEKNGLVIDSVTVTNTDSINLPLILKASLSANAYAQTAGDMIYLNPTIIYRMNDNPFKSSKRKYPVDFSLLSSRTIVTNIKLPEGFELKEKPENTSSKVGNSLSFTRQISATDNLVQIVTKMEIKEMQVKSQYYDQIKSLYSNMISSQSALLVIGPKTN